MWSWQQAQRPARRVEPPAVEARQPAWPAMPPIQRSIEALRPVAPQQGSADLLVSWRNPSYLAPLGHLVSADAPAGVIHRLIEPAAPPTVRPPGPALEFAAATPPRPSRGGVVQRMLAAISPWVSRDTEPPDAEPAHMEPAHMGPYRGYGTRDSPDMVPHPGEAALAAPLPASTPSNGPSAPRVALVQRSAAGLAATTPTPLTQAPSPALPVLELPVLQTTTEIATEPEPDGAGGGDVKPALAADQQSHSQVPTLGADSSSATQPVEHGDGPAAVSGSERGTSPAAMEMPGRPAAFEPTVQRAPEADPPQPRAGASRRLGLGPPLAPGAVTAQRSPTQPPSLAAPSSLAAPVAKPPLVADPILPLGPVDPPQVSEIGPSDTGAQEMRASETGVPEAGVTEGKVESPASLREQIAPLVGQAGAVAVQRDGAMTDGAEIPQSPVQTVRDASPLPPTSTGSAGLLPADSSLPVLGVQGVVSGVESATAVPPVVQSPGSLREQIAPLVGQAGAVAVQRDGALTDGAASDGAGDGAGDGAAGDVVAGPQSPLQTVRDASPPLTSPTGPAGLPPADPSLPILPVLGAQDSSPFSESPTTPTAPPTPTSRPNSLPPVVARLVGDRIPPLLTVPAVQAVQHVPARDQTPGRPEPLMPTEPITPTGPAASGAPPAGYLSGGHAALPVQLTPSVGHLAAAAHPAAGAHPATAARPAAVGHSTAAGQPAAVAYSAPRQALVVQTAPTDPAPAEIAEPAEALPAQDLPPDLGADVPGGADIPGQAPSAAPAGTPPAGAPAAGAAAAASNPDELVKKLFDPLLRRLKTELRLDRERRGMLTDLRH